MGSNFQTKSEIIFENVRAEIIEGKMKPGQRIVMRDIAKRFNMSEIPVREAICRLESDGFIVYTPHVGAVVSKIEEDEFFETYLIRIELEGLATRLATPYIKKNDIKWLEKKNQEMENALKKNSPEKLGKLNKDFHLRIYKVSPYKYLYKLIDDLWERFERTKSVFAYVPERAAASVTEHYDIINALKNKDFVEAEEIMKKQKERTMKVLQKFLNGNTTK